MLRYGLGLLIALSLLSTGCDDAGGSEQTRDMEPIAADGTVEDAAVDATQPEDAGCALGAVDCACTGGGSCDPGAECQSGVCVALPACPEGRVDCPCADGECLGDAVCERDVCVVAECSPGQRGCPCTATGRCGFTEAGDALVCDDGTCVAEPCPAGATGCACDGGACDAEGDICLDDLCAPDACDPGLRGCPCDLGDQCDDPADACEANLCRPAGCAPGESGCACDRGRCLEADEICDGGQCVAPDCPAGDEGCACAGGTCQLGLGCVRDLCVDVTGGLGGACYANGTCDAGLSCAGGVCSPCLAGFIGCACAPTGCALGAACVGGLCVDAAEVPPETSPCFTPCASGSFLAAQNLRCPADGLLAGCVSEGRSCQKGSCLLEGEPLPVCETDLQCPDFQRCIGGECHSNCGNDGDCAQGNRCFRKVCRAECGAEAPCGPGYRCETRAGESTVCMPVAPAMGAPQRESVGAASVSRSALRFTNVSPSGVFALRNESDQRVTFTVRKRSHTLYTALGQTEQRNDPFDPQAEAPCDPQQACPLTWLRIGEQFEGQLAQSVEVVVPPRGETTIEVNNADASPGVRWTGVLEIVSAQLNPVQVHLEFSQVPDGQWKGTVYYFGQFADGGLNDWLALDHGARQAPFGAGTRDDQEAINNLNNAFLRAWTTFRRGRMSWAEFQAVMRATRTESWRVPEVQRGCTAQYGGQTVCYPYEGGPNGLSSYTANNNTSSIPSGLIDLPIALNLRQVPGGAPVLEGRIETSGALHYAGNPTVRLPLANAPTDCSRNAVGACLVFFDADATRRPATPLNFNQPCVADALHGCPMARLSVGGRYEAQGGGCAVGYEAVKVPWLPQDFTREVEGDPELGQVRYECRSRELPFADDPAGNLSLAGSNPVPDGRPRRRSLWLLDGAIINQEQIIILFEERFESFLDPNDTEGFSAYGYMVLQRNREGDLDLADANNDGTPDLYEGGTSPAASPGPQNLLERVSCPAAIGDHLPAGANARVRTLVEGIDVSGESGACVREARANGTQACLEPSERVHYLCDGKFNGGPDRARCPEGARLVFFTQSAQRGDPGQHPCNTNSSCGDVLTDWDQGGSLIQHEPLWICAEDEATVCNRGVWADAAPGENGDRRDMRAGRIFFSAAAGESVFPSLTQAIAEAFRYKVQFRGRDGSSVGFAPEICQPGGRNPYCYDPPRIEELRGRMDCLLAEWRAELDRPQPALSQANRDLLMNTLVESYSSGPVGVPNVRPEDVREGYERLYAELLIMQGDEALTRAYGSRFDLAGGRGLAFAGSAFEPGGINLAGVAGGELSNLYLAKQYYEEALQRFYSQAPTIWRATVQGDPTLNFVTPGLVMEYLERLVRAATQKTRAASAIAQRYQTFNRPDLARGVIEREFTSAYLESIVLSRMTLGVVDGVEREDRDQIRLFAEEAQARYRAALLDMQRVYSSLRDNVNAFGFAPDYMPFFTIDLRESNAFERALTLAQQRLGLAREREDSAINANRSFETDTAEFQAELVRIRNTYESQLREVCGSVVIEDANGGTADVVPATRRYAALLPELQNLGDPCGFVGNGDIHSGYGQVELARLDIERILQQMENVRAEVSIEINRIARHCGCPQCRDVLPGTACTCRQESLLEVARSHVRTIGGLRVDLTEEMQDNQFAINRIQGSLQIASTITQSVSCQPIAGCVAVGVATGTYSALAIGSEIAVSMLEKDIQRSEIDLLELQTSEAEWALDQACDQAYLDSTARVNTTLLRLRELELDALRADYQMRLAMSEVSRLFNRAQRLQLEEEEARQMAVNVAAARNDPNIRIYRNDAVINADVAFDAAMRDAYRATLVFEYYTSQSYARRGDLFLIRLIARGERNLEDYLADLQNAFIEFEEEFGLPDLRLMKVSLMDDIFRIRRLRDDGSAMTAQERIDRLRERLRDPALLDRRGYLTLPFQTRITDLSPATRNHKIYKVVAEISGEATDEGSARLYLVQGGTSQIRSVDGDTLYFRFPPQAAVLNARFNRGATGVDPAIYDNLRLRDRPMAATDWQLVINQRDESINQDLDLQTVSDIVLFVYYTDFTEY